MSRLPARHSRDHRPNGYDALGTPWFYLTPIDPASPEGVVYDDAPAALFEEPWSNIELFEASAFRLTESGHVGLRIVATGGEEETLPSLITNLPAGFRPVFVQRRFAVVGTGTAGIIEARPDGDVVYVGLVEAAP